MARNFAEAVIDHTTNDDSHPTKRLTIDRQTKCFLRDRQSLVGGEIMMKGDFFRFLAVAILLASFSCLTGGCYQRTSRTDEGVVVAGAEDAKRAAATGLFVLK